MKYHLLLFLVIIQLGILSSCNNETSYKSYEAQKYEQLETVLMDTKVSLANYLNAMKAHSASICKDDIMTSFFLAKRDYYQLKKDTVLPMNIENKISELKMNIQNHYLMHYLNFYDILFIDTNGDIFYTIKKQKDYHKNIFDGELAETSLSANLKEKTGESYVDFQFYNISGEPSAFFIEPLVIESKTEGWFVLQCSVNKINSIFKRDEHLGETGEVLLVNKEHYLLTDSRFNVQSTILKQKLPTANIETKFKEGKGRKNVTDYRGKSVMSAFETFDFFGQEWLMITKIDRDEVLSNYYMDFEESQYPHLQEELLKEVHEYKSPYTAHKPYTNIEMDEFHRAEDSIMLFTQGVSTCTGEIASYPGRYSYMAHISPYDAIYNQTKTDITGHMLKQITHFDITGSEKENLQLEIVVVKPLALKQVIHKLLADGYFLSQISVYCNPDAEYANIYRDTESDSTFVNWKMPNRTDFVQFSSTVPTLSTIYRGTCE